MNLQDEFDTSLIRGAMGFSSDSRADLNNKVFVAIKGATHDGHSFINESLLNSCFKVIADINWLKSSSFSAHPKIIPVSNTHLAHRSCARYFRQQFKGIIIGVGGSSGKTSVKEFLYSILSKTKTCFKTFKSQNGELGIPKTLEQLDSKYQIGIIEIGIDAPGDMKRHCEIVMPDLAVLTSIGEEHLNLLKSVENVFNEEKILFDTTLANGGHVFAPSEDKYLVRYRGVPKVHFSEIADQSIYQFKNLSPIQIQNACLVAKVCRHLGLSVDEIAKGALDLKPAEGRGSLVQIRGNFLIEDHYNSNPSSLREGLNNFKLNKTQNSNLRSVLVLGDMLDLGDQSGKAHLEVLKEVYSVGASKIFLIGPEFSKAHKALNSQNSSVETISQTQEATPVVLDYLKNQNEHFLILFKGSRGMKLETCLEPVKQYLLNRN